MAVKTRYIFVTGGVLSGLGKGITAAVIGNILKARGFNVNMQKCDPYLNVDAGTLNPGEHGEVFVTDDGAETDLDLGHYERFTNESLTQKSSIMSGEIFYRVFKAERQGKFLGKTVQIIPHVVDEVQKAIIDAGRGYDFLIIEIGGTVGDYEGLHFMEAARRIQYKVDPENVIYTQVVFLPFLATTGEVKTKPAQNAARDMRNIGIQPNMLFARSDHLIGKDTLKKLSMYAGVEPAATIPMQTADNIYEIPLTMEKYGVGDYITSYFCLKKRKPNQSEWKDLAQKAKRKKKKIKIGMVAKYLSNHDTYLSVTEAITAACWNNGYDPEIVWIDAEEIEKGNLSNLKEICGIIVPGGFGSRGVEGKIAAAGFARKNKKPYLGLCLGMQTAVIEFARNVCKMAGAHTTEIKKDTKYPVIDLMLEQKDIKDKGGTMRLGAYPCRLSKGSISQEAYGKNMVSERHRHRFEFNNKYKSQLEKCGLRIAGVYPKRNLVEIIEIPEHPFFVAVQFHPEFKSRPVAPHPLFDAFIKACVKSVRQGTDQPRAENKK